MSLISSLEALRESSPELSKEAAAVRELRAKLPAMSHEDKCAHAYAYKLRGKSVQTIAQIFEIGVSTAYRYLSDHRDFCRQRLEQVPAANIIAETIEFYDHLEEICLHEINVTRTGDEEIDPTTGKVRSKGKDANFEKMSQVKFVQAALKARSLKTELLRDVGVIPKQPDQIYHTMRSASEDEAKAETAAAEAAESKLRRTADAIRGDLLELIMKGRKV